MSRFTRKRDAFTVELNKQNASDPRVVQLLALLPSLVPYKVVNSAKNVKGNVTQVGGKPAKAWTKASRLVAAIGSRVLSRRFKAAWKAAQRRAGIFNSVENVHGNVFQIGSIDRVVINQQEQPRRRRRRWFR